MSLGAEALVREWRADMAIVTEPTDLRLAIGHKGFAWIDIVTHGRAAHGSRPDEGRDAIARMGRVLVALEARDRELRARPPVAVPGHRVAARVDHHGRPRAQQLSGSLHRCRWNGAPCPARTSATVQARDRRDPRPPAPRPIPEFQADARVTAYRPAYRLDAAHALPRALGDALGARGLDGEPTGMSFWTDAAILAAAGIPSVLFGPGGAGLHSIVRST